MRVRVGRMKKINITATIGILASLPIVYAVSYLAMLKEPPRPNSGYRGQIFFLEPEYRVESPVCNAIFVPAHELDRIIRPSYWEREFNPPRLD